MQEELKNKKCAPCEGGTEPLMRTEAEALLQNVSNAWRLDGDKLVREFEFRDFAEALSFVNKVGAIAESEGHHPDLNIHNWNKAGVTLTTHGIGGLSENDFILAAKIDEL